MAVPAGGGRYRPGITVPLSTFTRGAGLAAGAVLVLTALASPSMATPSAELAPGSHPAPAVNASGQVVYHYDRSTQADRAARPRSGSPDMTFHGGDVMPSAAAHAIFWGTSWPTDTTDKISGMDTWYQGYGGSNYAGTATEYTGTNGQVSRSVAYDGHTVDGSAASGGANSSVILQEVAKVIGTSAVANGYYPVYTDVPRGNAKYCAYHSYGTIGTTRVQFAFFWKLDGDSGCDPQDTTTTHSQGLAAIANVSGHELAEAMTDPASPGAWYDSSGNENGDKCAWTFGAPTVTFSNKTVWKIQGEWSNKAYDGGTGYANSSGQKGCIPGS
jgi:hypothetical protein